MYLHHDFMYFQQVLHALYHLAPYINNVIDNKKN